MNWKEEMKKVLAENKKMLALFLLVIPMVIHAMYKFSLGPKFMEGAFGAGDLLGFYGEVLGGFVTLLVLWITTNETRQIQQKNEQQLEDDRKEREWEKRKAFADSIIDDFAMFCADSSAYKESQEIISKYKAEIEDFETKLKEIKNELEEKYEKYLIQEDDDTIPQIKRLNLEKEDLEDKIEFKRRCIEMIYTSRKTTQERFLVLRIKLDGIEGADHVIEQMNQLRRLGKDEKINFEDYLKDHKEVIKEMTTFIKKYVEG